MIKARIKRYPSLSGAVCDIQSVTADEIVCLTPKPLESNVTSFIGMSLHYACPENNWIDPFSQYAFESLYINNTL